MTNFSKSMEKASFLLISTDRAVLIDGFSFIIKIDKVLTTTRQ